MPFASNRPSDLAFASVRTRAQPVSPGVEGAIERKRALALWPFDSKAGVQVSSWFEISMPDDLVGARRYRRCRLNAVPTGQIRKPYFREHRIPCRIHQDHSTVDPYLDSVMKAAGFRQRLKHGLWYRQIRPVKKDAHWLSIELPYSHEAEQGRGFMAAVAPYVDKQTIRVAAPGGKSVGDVSDERKRRDSPVTLCKLLAEPLSDPGRLACCRFRGHRDKVF